MSLGLIFGTPDSRLVTTNIISIVKNGKHTSLYYMLSSELRTNYALGQAKPTITFRMTIHSSFLGFKTVNFSPCDPTDRLSKDPLTNQTSPLPLLG